MQVRIHGGPFDGQTRFVPELTRMLVLPANRTIVGEENVRRLGPAVAGYTAVYEQDGDEDSTEYRFLEIRSR